MFTISSLSHAHMIAQVRARQLATRDSQNLLQEKIIALWKENKIDSGEQFAKNIQTKLQEMYSYSMKIDNLLDEGLLHEIGYPIKTSKTSLQLKMAYEWSLEKDDDLLDHIEKNKLYHDLSNTIDTELPRQQSSSETVFWGNENPSVSSILLTAIGSIMGIETNTLPGCALRYPFYKSSYEIYHIPITYPFASKKNIWLFGDYQFGGQRYLRSKKSIFGPLDCSEAVANSTHVGEQQQLDFSTKDIRDAFFNEGNQYGYVPITSTYKESLKLDLIQSGDIYLCPGHTAIITDIDATGQTETIEFTRDIDTPIGKKLGGGTYSRNLIEKYQSSRRHAHDEVYILRNNRPPLKESSSYSNLIEKIDTSYCNCFGNKPKDIPGDCSIFISNHFWSE